MTTQDAAIAAHIVVAVSTVIVCGERFDAIVRKFRQFGHPDLVRSLVGATTGSLATGLLAGIPDPVPVADPALVVAALMLGGQDVHAGRPQ